MSRPRNPHPDDLNQTLASAFDMLSRGVSERRSAFHTPGLATIGLDGAPAVRVVVLRGFDAAARVVRIHTDLRGKKVAEMLRDPRVSLLFYDPQAAVQVRLGGAVTVHADDPVADAGWAASRPASRMCYAIDPAPGSEVPSPPPAPVDADAGRTNFAVLRVVFESLEWLWLSVEGHRRAAFDLRDGKWAGRWLVP